MLFLPLQRWPFILSRLKLRPCPHCSTIGTLNAHGYLRGYGEASSCVIRARRIFCSNRGSRPGCGRTHSFFPPNIIPAFQFLAELLWRFLSLLLLGATLRGAFLSCFGMRDTGRAYGLWKRCLKAQLLIRHRLTMRCHPPPSKQQRPFLQVLEHLVQAFPNSLCPIAAYQEYFGVAFL